MHDDLADKSSPDPIARLSTRLTCAVGTNGQVSYDPRFIKATFPEFDVTQHPAVAAFVGAPKGADLQSLSPEQYALYEQGAAITYASADDPPFLIMHGDQDPLVPIAQSRELAEALKAVGVNVTFEVVKGAGHGGPAFLADDAMRRVTAFFDEHLKPAKAPPAKAAPEKAPPVKTPQPKAAPAGG